MDKVKKEILLKKTIINFVKNQACFDLQFRRDVKHKRTNKPVYYSWKAQFILMGKYEDEDLIREIQKILNCGRLHFSAKNQIRYSVQSLDDLYQKVIPFLRGLKLSKNKKQDFEWWSKAVEILFENKGKTIKEWKKQDFLELMEIQKTMQKYKAKKGQSQKWLSQAELLADTLP